MGKLSKRDFKWLAQAQAAGQSWAETGAPVVLEGLIFTGPVECMSKGRETNL
jgi:hypothetical protein